MTTVRRGHIAHGAGYRQTKHFRDVLLQTVLPAADTGSNMNPPDGTRMIKELLQPEIIELIKAQQWEDLREILEEWPVAEIADILVDLSPV